MNSAALKKLALTPRELDVARELAHGSSRKVIAANLKISIPTVADYLIKIRHKTGTNSMLEAACFLSPDF